MTFLSLIALALGMIGAADAAAPRPSFAAISISRASRASRRAFSGVGVSRRFAREHSENKPRFRTSPLRRIVAPLSGAATPRAPEPVR
ncbi:MAG TPA: hypothetical protein VEK11_09860 [Thermoanaerobaculia bacterium]|nr:hypothetical protein [Thermoanaerobaculia bacterium]